MKIIVPASTSNLGPGFDTLGLAVNRYLVIEAEQADRLSVEVEGEGAARIPVGEDNLTVKAAKQVLKELPGLKIKIQNGIPDCGGFGASGAAIVAGLLIGSEVSERKLEIEEIYNIAIQIEGHPDNVSAALFGGLVVNARGSGGRYSHIKVPVDNRLKFVSLLPDSRVETGSARKMLPTSVSMTEAVSNVQHSSLLVAALTSGNYEMIKYATRDELHEKHRKKLIPHFEDFQKAAVENGAVAFTVSGAGSSCVAFCLDDPSKVYEALSALAARIGPDWRVEVMEPVNKGAEILERQLVTNGQPTGKS